MAGVGAFAAAGALSGAFVAPGGQVQHSEPQMQRTNLRAAGYGSSQATGVGAMAGLGAVAGLAAAGVAGKRASKGRTSLQAVGVGINGFGRIGRQVARIAMKDPETELKFAYNNGKLSTTAPKDFEPKGRLQAELRMKLHYLSGREVVEIKFHRYVQLRHVFKMAYKKDEAWVTLTQGCMFHSRPVITGTGSGEVNAGVSGLEDWTVAPNEALFSPGLLCQRMLFVAFNFVPYKRDSMVTPAERSNPLNARTWTLPRGSSWLGAGLGTLCLSPEQLLSISEGHAELSAELLIHARLFLHGLNEVPEAELSDVQHIVA
ncbi:GAPC1 [Symbiodinium microadriaticum]|nr:GAPC1 [Symbiodinium microadriaticum]